MSNQSNQEKLKLLEATYTIKDLDEKIQLRELWQWLKFHEHDQAEPPLSISMAIDEYLTIQQ